MSKKNGIPKAPSPGEEQFANDCHMKFHPVNRPVREHRFHPTRKWRFDFAWPSYKLAVEIEGGIWSAGAHTRGKHFESDAEKYNAAAKMGWRVLRYSTEMVMRGLAINDVLEVLR